MKLTHRIGSMRHRRAKTAEQIELPFGMVRGGGPRNRVLYRAHAHKKHISLTRFFLARLANLPKGLYILPMFFFSIFYWLTF